MRTTILRGILALTAFVALATPAVAQSVVRGTAKDANGQPVADAKVLFKETRLNRTTENKTNEKGEFLQVGLPSADYDITVSKGDLEQTIRTTVVQGQNEPLSFTLAPGGGGGLLAGAAAETKEQQDAARALQAVATTGQAHMEAGRYAEAIAAFSEIVATIPTCADCYYNIGMAHASTKNYPEAEAAFLKMIELKPDAAEAYTGLASVYNAQREFDKAREASSKAAELTGAAGGGGSAEAAYNRGVILFNSGDFAGAKEQFVAATQADPNNALAQYQLGMTSLNLGQIPEAVAALEAYLKVAPDGDKAAEVKGALPALQQMLKQ